MVLCHLDGRIDHFCAACRTNEKFVSSNCKVLCMVLNLFNFNPVTCKIWVI